MLLIHRSWPQIDWILSCDQRLFTRGQITWLASGRQTESLITQSYLFILCVPIFHLGIGKILQLQPVELRPD